VAIARRDRQQNAAPGISSVLLLWQSLGRDSDAARRTAALGPGTFTLCNDETSTILDAMARHAGAAAE
jgi:hypothetical protein